jgi:hypothetical protein
MDATFLESLPARDRQLLLGHTLFSPIKGLQHQHRHHASSQIRATQNSRRKSSARAMNGYQLQVVRLNLLDAGQRRPCRLAEHCELQHVGKLHDVGLR